MYDNKTDTTHATVTSGCATGSDGRYFHPIIAVVDCKDEACTPRKLYNELDLDSPDMQLIPSVANLDATEKARSGGSIGFCVSSRITIHL